MTDCYCGDLQLAGKQKVVTFVYKDKQLLSKLIFFGNVYRKAKDAASSHPSVGLLQQ